MTAILILLTWVLGDLPVDAPRRVGWAFDGHDTEYRVYPSDTIGRYDLLLLYGDAPVAGWYYDFGSHPSGVASSPLDFAAQMLWRVPDTITLQSILVNNPGDVIILGNEPDISEQQNLSSGNYAVFYHDAAVAIRAIEPGRRLASAGIAAGTPERLAYLQGVLDAYRVRYGERMPVDVWTLHVYDSLPVPDQVVAMRLFMQRNGYQDAELWVTEMVGDANYLRSNYDWLLRAQADYGLERDDGRLVQRFAWFALNQYKDFPGYMFTKQAELSPFACVFREWYGSEMAELYGYGHAERSYIYYFPAVFNNR